MDLLVLAIVGVFAGVLGSMVGLGGGVLVVPILSLFLGVPIQTAIAASAVGVVANSTTAAINYVRGGVANIRLGLTLESMTVVGAVVGATVMTLLSREWLSAIFAFILVVMAGYLYYRQSRKQAPIKAAVDTGLFGGHFFDPFLHQEVAYRVRRLPVGLGASLLAGGVSGLLGIGGGAIQVPVMAGAMDVPMKAASATSNFMMGITACASAIVYYGNGLIDPSVTVPVVLGVMLGSFLGSRLAPRVNAVTLTLILSVILLLLAVQMGLAAVGIRYR